MKRITLKFIPGVFLAVIFLLSSCTSAYKVTKSEGTMVAIDSTWDVNPDAEAVTLTPEEQEELRKREERKDKLHQNYLRRKASGAQKAWEKRYNAKRKAQIEAAKAAIREEDISNGVFIPVGQLPQQVPQKAPVQAHAAV